MSGVCTLDRDIKEVEQELGGSSEPKPMPPVSGCKPSRGLGPIGTTALLGAVGDGRAFRSGRELAAWLGLVPRQDTPGGKPRLYGISKRGGNKAAPRAAYPRGAGPWCATRRGRPPR